MKKALFFFLTLYILTLQISMAGMEIFGWAVAIVGLALWVANYRAASFTEFKKQIYLPWLDLSLLGLAITIALGLAINAPEHARNLFLLGSARWILMLVLLRVALTQVRFESTKKVAKTAIVVSGIIGAYAIYQYFTGNDLVRGNERKVLELFGTRANGLPYFRAAGFFSMPTTFAHSLAQWACLPFAYFIAKFGDRDRFKWIAIGLGAVAALGIVASLTRGAWLSFPVALFALVLLGRPRLLPALFAGMIVAGLALYTLLPEITQRASTIVASGTQVHSNHERLSLWRVNLEMVKEHPLIGVGYDTNELLSVPYMQKLGIEGTRGGNAHNAMLQMLAGTGVVGFAFYLVMTLGLLWISIRVLRGLAPEESYLRSIVLAMIGAQVATLVGGITDCNFQDAEVNHSVIFTFACVATLYCQKMKSGELYSSSLNQA